MKQVLAALLALVAGYAFAACCEDPVLISVTSGTYMQLPADGGDVFGATAVVDNESVELEYSTETGTFRATFSVVAVE